MLPRTILKRIDSKLSVARVMHLKHTDDGIRFQVASVKCRICRDSKGGYVFISVKDGACFHTTGSLAEYIWKHRPIRTTRRETCLQIPASFLRCPSPTIKR